MTTRARLAVVTPLVAALAACTAFVVLRPRLEDAAARRVIAAARAAGLSATLRAARLSPLLSLELDELVLEGRGGGRFATHRAVLSPDPSLAGLVGRAARLELSPAVVELPAGLRLEFAASRWRVERQPRAERLELRRPGERLMIDSRREGATRLVHAHAEAVRLSSLVRVLWHGCVALEPGTVDGDARLEQDAGGPVRLAVDARARAFAVASWTAGGGEGCPAAGLGAPTDAALKATVLVDAAAGRLRADSFRVSAGPAEAQGRFAAQGGLADPRIELDVEVPRLDFDRLLAAAGLDLPADDLGSAAAALRVTGPLLDPAALVVTQRLDFTPPARPLPSIERLRGPFVHEAETRTGGKTAIRVSPDSPDFVALAEVPPLFQRALLIAEDANFYGHPGVDLSELPVALATNFARGGFARGGSTLSQQLAKNLFLSRRKTISRKLEEASLALLLDRALGKSRVLEIYLNVIEWGPGVYGLRPAARHYFGVEPQALTAKQTAFLVSLIPGPVKYQRSFAGGVPTSFFDGLMTTLLTKLASVGAISEEECAAAIAEPLALAPGAAPEPR